MSENDSQMAELTRSRETHPLSSVVTGSKREITLSSPKQTVVDMTGSVSKNMLKTGIEKSSVAITNVDSLHTLP